MDNELFELCKEVYKRTAWDSNLERYYVQSGMIAELMYQAEILPPDMAICPLYTSDYLLEKLPAKLTHNNTEYFYYLEMFDDGSFGSGYGFTDAGGHIDHPLIGVVTDDKALKANLKLVIALNDAGVKL